MQEVIIYRNPMEAAMWNAIMDGSFFPVIVGVVVFFCVFLATNRVLNKGRTTGKNVERNANIALAVGAASAITSIYFML